MIPVSVSVSGPCFRLRTHWMKKPGVQEEEPNNIKASIQGMIPPILPPKRCRLLVQETVHLRKGYANTDRFVEKGSEFPVTFGYSESAFNGWTPQGYRRPRSLTPNPGHFWSATQAPGLAEAFFRTALHFISPLPLPHECWLQKQNKTKTKPNRTKTFILNILPATFLSKFSA